MPRRCLAKKADGSPTNKTQRNFTDPESHFIQSGGSYLQAYNCKLAVNADHQVIVAVGVSNLPPDVEHLEPMLKRIASHAGALPDVVTMDAGFWSEDRCPKMLMPESAWPANSEARRGLGSTPSAKRSWNR